MFGVLAFLQHVPDRPRAAAAFARVGPLLLSGGLVALEPSADGESHSPLDFAPLPSSLARGLFSEATIEAHLDHLAGAQRDDGGWMFNWPSWSPAAEADWRGFLTVDVLRILRANGRAWRLRTSAAEIPSRRFMRTTASRVTSMALVPADRQADR